MLSPLKTSPLLFRSSDELVPLSNCSSILNVPLNVGLTIQETIKVKALQVLPLSHKAVQRGCPTFCQNLHPLHIHLVNETAKENVLLHSHMNKRSNNLQKFNLETNTSRMITDYTNLIKIKGTTKMCISLNKCE